MLKVLKIKKIPWILEMVELTLRDKTNQKFKSFFEKVSKMHSNEEFEIAFSEIQRETGAANITMKRAIESLEAEGWFEVKPGRNSRYGRFKIASTIGEAKTEAADEPSRTELKEKEDNLEHEQFPKENTSQLVSEIVDLERLVESLRRRLRTQEMTIALLQDRVAEIEDKLFKH